MCKSVPAVTEGENVLHVPFVSMEEVLADGARRLRRDFPQDALVVIRDVHLGQPALEATMTRSTQPEPLCLIRDIIPTTDGEPFATTDEALADVIRRCMDAGDQTFVFIDIGDLTDNFGRPGRDPNRTIEEELDMVRDDLTRQPRSPSFSLAEFTTPAYLDRVREALHDCDA